MALTPSHRPTREWPLLILTLGLVGLICFPLWGMLVSDDASGWAEWTAERWGRLLLGPEQIACYCCFVWACFILDRRYLELRRHPPGFRLVLFPLQGGLRLHHGDATPPLTTA